MLESIKVRTHKSRNIQLSSNVFFFHLNYMPQHFIPVIPKAIKKFLSLLAHRLPFMFDALSSFVCAVICCVCCRVPIKITFAYVHLNYNYYRLLFNSMLKHHGILHGHLVCFRTSI